MIDCSEPFFLISGVSGFVGFVVSLIYSNFFEMYVGLVCLFMSSLGVYRVRKLGVGAKIVESVEVLKLQNQNLQVNTSRLEGTVSNLESKLENLNDLMNIMDTNNKTAEEIQSELSSLVEEYKKQNSRYDRNNKIALFYTTDMNRDGYLEGDELETLKEALSDTVPGVDELFNGRMSRKEVLKKLFKEM